MAKGKNKISTALKVHKGIEQPDTINAEGVKNIAKRKTPDAEELLQGVLAGNRTALGRAITLAESTQPAHQKAAQTLIQSCLPYAGKSVRIGITGVPGAGKSTFIEALGRHLTGQGHKLAVLAVDPSSTKTRGSILGDKVRMEELSADPSAFIRPSPSAGTLGGVARKTWESIMLCEAAGYDVVFVETVGVGQSETTVHSMVDFFLLLLIPGAGDEIQGIKRGIVEMADAIVINKTDGDNLIRAGIAKTEYENALHLFPAPASGYPVKVMCCSALEKSGIDNVWSEIKSYLQHTQSGGYFAQRRSEQSLLRMHHAISEALMADFYAKEEMIPLIREAEENILKGNASAYAEAMRLTHRYLKK